jgi:hypothetical protein
MEVRLRPAGYGGTDFACDLACLDEAHPKVRQVEGVRSLVRKGGFCKGQNCPVASCANRGGFVREFWPLPGAVVLSGARQSSEVCDQSVSRIRRGYQSGTP